MKSATRRTSLVLAWALWALLALLPLRGVANVLMHLPTNGQPTAVSTSAALPCHVEVAAGEEPASAQSCTLCDLCNGAALAGFAGTAGADVAQPVWSGALAAAPPAGLPSPFFRPPRA